MFTTPNSFSSSTSPTPTIRATSSDLRDLLFEQHMRRIAGPRSGLMVAMLRRIGAERGIMTHIENVAEEYADLYPRKREHIDIRDGLVVVDGGG